MAWSKQAKKRIRQNEKRKQENKAIKSAMRTHMKKVAASIQDKEISRKDAEEHLAMAASHLDKAAKKNIIHKNKASRLKSRLAKALNREKPSEKKD